MSCRPYSDALGSLTPMATEIHPVAKATLLLIDDDASVRESMAGYLEDSGYRVMQAADGETGLAAYQQNTPDLILCDLRMPRKDGLGVLQSIVDAGHETPFIVISGAGVMSDVVTALRLGASDFIVKPVTDMAVVEHAIDKVMERSRLLAENASYRETLEATNQRLEATVETLEADLRAGRHVQQAMLPSRPFRAGDITVDYRLLPSLFLSGDYVDYFELQPGVLLHYIVDVSGHGVSSAMVTILLRNEVNRLRTEWRYSISRVIEQPARVLAHLNRELLRSRIGKHATLFIGLLDTHSGVYRYANAGHFPYPVIYDGTTVRTLEKPSAPIGLLADPAYAEYEFQYAGDLSVALASDGLLEIDACESLAAREKRWQEQVVENEFDITALSEATGIDGLADVPDDITVMTLTHRKKS